jgi:hypothetical protein
MQYTGPYLYTIYIQGPTCIHSDAARPSCGAACTLHSWFSVQNTQRSVRMNSACVPE